MAGASPSDAAPAKQRTARRQPVAQPDGPAAAPRSATPASALPPSNAADAAPAPAATIVAQAPRLITDEDVRVRAYFLSLEHRGQGRAEDFWLLAEREQRAER